ncbi:CARDB domain-containing protein, partial [Microcystis sp. M061S2]|uniref:CARDB domain-containing protein n=1 Tax=Microcystis sp. M061S2 TaxID=2771171 RepID=UPI00258AE6AE
MNAINLILENNLVGAVDTGELYINAILLSALDQVRLSLKDFANAPDFLPKIQLAFGDSFAPQTAFALAQDWAKGDVTIPLIKILPDGTLNGAYGVYAGATNTIYLSEEFLRENTISSITSAVLEEFGHSIDGLLNDSDSPGDEGQIFAALVQGIPLPESELQALKQENDFATIFIDGQEVLIEKATVSDSGGFEGSRQIVILESKGGGVAKFTYQHFTIPDQFIIRYEGRELLNTGFVGGGRTGQVQIPKGNSNQLEVIVATNNQGTAWNYTVTTETCPDTGPFVLELVGGKFKDADGDGDCEGQGTIYIGRKDGISRMLKVDGTVEYTDKKISVNGIVTSVIGAGVVKTNPLFQGQFDLNIGSGTTSSFKETGKLATEYTLGGLDVDFSGITINRNGLALGAKFKLLEEIGFPEFPFSGSDALLISQNNVTFGSSVKFSLPNFKDFKLFKFLPIKKLSNFSIEYIAPEDKIKIQGKLVIDDFTKTEKLGTITADLAGSNSIEIQGGKADIKGSLAVETDLKLVKGWGLKELKLNIDTKNKDIGGSTKIEFPFKKAIPPGNAEATTELGFKLPIPPLELNKVSLDVDNLNIPIPQFPLVFFQGFNGSVENLAKSDPDPIEFAGGVKATLGPQLDVPLLGRSALIRVDLNGQISSEQLSGTGQVIILNEKIAKADGTSTLNWNNKFYETKGNFSLLDGLIQTSSGFKVGSSFDVNMSGVAKVSIPNFIPLFGGTQISSGNFLLDFSNDGNLSNDFAAGWGTINIQKLGFEINVVVGVKGYFNGRFERIGAKNIPPIGSFAIAPDTDWILLSADWENAVTGNIPVQIETPDGTIINESDFAANNIAVVEELSDSTTKVVVIFNPQPGIWDINVVDPTGLGAVKYTAATDSFLPTIDITSPATDVGGREVTINYNAFDADSNAEVKLFYDTDNQGFDGILIAGNLLENDGAGSFLWNTEGIPTGDYFIYAMVIDENNPPAFDYSQGRVRITEEADLSVTQTVNPGSVVAGKNLSYKVTVTNNGSIDSKNVTLVETLPAEVTFVSSTTTPSQQSGNTLTFELGDLAQGATKTFDIIVTAPSTPGIITATAAVNSTTFDPDSTNDVDILTTTVEEIPPEISDLSVTRTDATGAVALGQQYTYALTVTNNGPSTANNLILTENLPSGVNVISATAKVNTNSSGVVTANLGSLNSGDTITVNLTVSSFVAGDLISTTNVSGNENDFNSSNNSLISTKTVNSIIPANIDLELAQTVNNPNPQIGNQVTFTLTLTNKGPGTATAIQVRNLLPTGLSFISALAEQGIYDSSTGIWDVGNMRDNLSRTLTIKAQVNSGGSLTNTAEVTAVFEADIDSTPNNNNPNEDDQASVIVTIGTDETPSNQAPTNLALSATTVNENVAPNTVIGTFSSTDPDTGNSFIYSLVTGTGDTDNSAFSIVGNQLQINNSPDFETKNSYSIRVKTTDQGGLSFEKTLTITVNDVNETPSNQAPTDLALSATTVNENVPVNTVIGTFSSTDPDTGNSFIYSLVTGTGDTDNSAFSIVGNQLQINNSPDFETKNSYSIRVKTTDQGGLSFEKTLTIAVNNVNETPSNQAPTDLALSATTVNENVPVNTVIGTFSSTDPDSGNSFTYSLVTGTGDTDNSAFSIVGNQLQINNSPDFETKNSYSIRVKTTDQGGLSFEKTLTIAVNDVNETPSNQAPTALIFQNAVTELAENVNVTP